MASLNRDKGRNGTTLLRIQFVDGGGDRRAIRLGAVPVKVGQEILRRVEELVAAQVGNVARSADLAAWLRDLPEDTYGKLAHAKLVEPRAAAVEVTLAEMCRRFMAAAVGKPGTILIYRQCIDSMLRFFGASTPLRSIAPEQGDAWKKWLSEPHETVFGRAKTKAIRKLAVATQAKRLEVGRQVFRCGVRWGLMEKNPLEGVRGGSKVNSKRSFYVTPEMIATVIANCPNMEWRLIFALARYAGLRCPSELVGLSWQHVNWEKASLRVYRFKTEHHAGGEESIIPIDPRLMAVLTDAFEQAPVGATLIVPAHQNPKANLGTHGTRIIKAAGVKAWPKPFQNMRSSCETEWLETYPIKAVCDWIGNSEAVCLKHYAQVLPEHFISATGGDAAHSARKAAHNAAHQTAQNAAQQVPLGKLMEVDKNKKTVVPRGKTTVSIDNLAESANDSVGATRFERATSTSRT